jgi:hypothetical protein
MLLSGVTVRDYRAWGAFPRSVYGQHDGEMNNEHACSERRYQNVYSF